MHNLMMDIFVQMEYTMLWTGDTDGIMSKQFFVETSDMLEKIVSGFNRPDGTILGMSSRLDFLG